MSSQRILPTVSGKSSILVTLSGCASSLALMEGKLIHDAIVKNAYEKDAVVSTSMLNMYGKCGSPNEARNVFDRVQAKDVILWNAMISAYAQSGLGNEAIAMFSLLIWHGETPNEATFVGLLSASSCRGVSSLQAVKAHVCIIECGLDSALILGNALVTAYARSRGSLDVVTKAFDEMRERNVVSWNVIISAYAQHGQGVEALLFLFLQMMMEGVLPNKATFVVYLSSCTAATSSSPRASCLEEAKMVHARVLSSVGVDTVLGNSLVHVYGRCKCSGAAWDVFDAMPEQSVVARTTLLANYARDGQGRRALQTFEQMHQEGLMPDKVALIAALDACDRENNTAADGDRMHVKAILCSFLSDAVVATAIVKMYGRCNDVEKAKAVFEDMAERREISSTTMLTALARNALDKEALMHFRNMQREGLVADSFVLGSLLDACASRASLADAIRLHSSNIVESGYESDAIVGTALLNLYGKCGCLSFAQRSFDALGRRDLVAWNALIASYAQHGHAIEALELLIQMQQSCIAPNLVTFVSVLSACSHAGLVSEGFWCLSAMHRKHRIAYAVEHYDCIVDLLSRAGMLTEAEVVIRKMPLRPTAASLMPLLSACRCQSDIDTASRVAASILSKYPENAGSYVVLANIYSTGDDDRSADIADGENAVESLLRWEGNDSLI